MSREAMRIPLSQLKMIKLPTKTDRNVWRCIKVDSQNIYGIRSDSEWGKDDSIIKLDLKTGKVVDIAESNDDGITIVETIF